MVPSNVDLMALSALAGAIVALVLALIAVFKQSAVLRRYRMLLRLPTGMDMEQFLLNHGAALDKADQRLIALETLLQQTRTEATFHVQHVGVVRFSAFPDVGSDLSYSVALLDAHRDGIVFTSLYGRNECRVYAKPIKNGTSTYKLTGEEQEAMAKAVRATPP